MSLSFRINDQPRRTRARVVHRLVRHPRAHRPVADHRDDVVALPPQVPRHRHSQSRRDRGRAVRRPKRVVDALRPPRETRQPPALPQRPHPLPPPRQNLVRIGLVTHIPHHTVARRVEHVMQRHRQLHHPQTRPQMTPRHRHRIDQLLPQFRRNRPKITFLKATQIRRAPDPVQQRPFIVTAMIAVLIRHVVGLPSHAREFPQSPIASPNRR